MSEKKDQKEIEKQEPVLEDEFAAKDENVSEEEITEKSTIQKINGSLSKIYLKVKTVTKAILSRFFKLIIPQFAPRYDMDEAKLPEEEVLDYANVRHYNEGQIIIGLFLALAMIFLGLTSNALYFYSALLGIILIVFGFDIEEVYVTTLRVIVRKIGLVERFTRIPSDEEHLLKHLVYFNIGRAPIQKILFGIGLVATFSLAFSDDTIAIIISLITAITFLIMGLRLGKRTITLRFAGNHILLLGERKGIPLHIFESLKKSVYQVK